MSKPFQVGDRVMVRFGGRGRVNSLNAADSSLLDVTLDGGVAIFANANECRRLVKKPRRRVWIKETDIEGDVQSGDANFNYKISGGVIVATEARPGWTEFIEVRKPKGEK